MPESILKNFHIQKHNCCKILLTSSEALVGVCGLPQDCQVECAHFSCRGIDVLGRDRVICDGHFNDNNLQHSSLCYSVEAVKEATLQFKERMCMRKLESL